MASIALLCQLPLDGIRPILSFLDLKSLTLLFATFDRRIQRLLSAPGAFAFLRILAPTSIPKAPLRYFLMSVRQVAHLEFENDVGWSPATLPLLQAMNPRILDLGRNFMHPSALNLLRDASKSPQNENLARMAHSLMPSGLPRLAVLTPRLEALSLDFYSILPYWKVMGFFAHHSTTPTFEIQLPPTLTSLTCQLLIDPDIRLPHIPPGIPPNIKSLALNSGEVEMSYIFKQFPSLGSLQLSNCNILVEGPFTMSSLESLSLDKMSDIPSGFLSHPAFAESSMSQFKLSVFDPYWAENGHSFSLVLPHRLTSLELDLYDFPCCSLPLSLTRLLLNIETQTSSIIDMVYRLQGLVELVLLTGYSSGGLNDAEPTYTWVFKSLARTLRILELNRVDNDLSWGEIASFPPALTRLQLPSFPLKHMESFRERYPCCPLHITSPMSFWSHGNGEFLREKFMSTFSPLLDLNSFAISLNRYYSILQVRFVLMASAEPISAGLFSTDTKTVTCASHPASSGLVTFDPTLMLRTPNLAIFCPSAVSMDLDIPDSQHGSALFLPSMLTHLDLHATIICISMDQLPSCLTWLSSQAANTPSGKWSPTRLVHLDTPNWCFPGDWLGNMRDLQVFNGRIDALADFNVVDLLTKAVNRTPHLRMKIALSCLATGSLVQDMADVTWDAIVAESSKMVTQILATPLPTPDSETLLLDPITPVDTIGSVVTSFKVTLGAEHLPISLPGSATRICLYSSPAIKSDWELAVEPRFASPNGLQSQRRSLFDQTVPAPPKLFNAFPRQDQLHTLVLSHVRVHEHWLEALPDSLVFLRIRSKSYSIPQSSALFPSRLKALVLEDEAQETEFDLSRLPDTILHLVLNQRLSLAIEQRPVALPLLRTVLFKKVDYYSLVRLVSKLSPNQLERFNAIQVSDAGGNVPSPIFRIATMREFEINMGQVCRSFGTEE